MGPIFLKFLAVFNQSKFLNFGLGLKEIQFSRALIWYIYSAISLDFYNNDCDNSPEHILRLNMLKEFQQMVF